MSDYRHDPSNKWQQRLAGRRYYSVRTGKLPGGSKIEFSMLLRLFRDLYLRLEIEGYFQEYFGYNCVDAPGDGLVPGALGPDIAAQVFRGLRKDNLWPITDQCLKFAEDDLFDVIEYLYDHTSKGVDGRYHTFAGCGWHYDTFDSSAGRYRFRCEVNELLRDYQEGYELSTQGEILALAPQGLEDLLQEGSRAEYQPEISALISSAVLKFRRYHGSADDRRDAVRDLADVLEVWRPKLKEVLTEKDESDLFNIANNFGIRHRNDKQKTAYDKEIWYQWMFYYYLATINAACKLIEKQGTRDLDDIPF